MSDDYGGGGWGGNRPSVFTKIDEGKERGSLLGYFRTIIGVSMLVWTLLYVSFNTVFKGWDWYAIFLGLTLVSTGAIYWWLTQRWGTVYTFRFGNGRERGGVMFSLRAIILSAGWLIGIGVGVVPVMVNIFEFPEGASLSVMVATVLRPFVFALMFSTILGAVPMVYRGINEIWRPSSQFSSEKVYVEREKRLTAERLLRLKYELENDDGDDSDDGSPQKMLPPVLVKSAPARTLSPAEAFRLSVISFLEMVEAEEISTEQRSWTGKVLSRSNRQLTRTLGNEIRDFLIRSGHASWTGDNKRGSWQLDYPIEVIIASMEAYENGHDIDAGTEVFEAGGRGEVRGGSPAEYGEESDWIPQQGEGD